MPRPALLPAFVLLVGVAAAGAQVPAGPEFRVNASTLGTQETPDVVFQPDGGFIIVWADADGFGFGIRGQAYDPAGAPRGASFQVNTYTTNQQRFYGGARSVAADARGRFVVAWSSYGQDGSYEGVFARRFDANGAPLGPEFQLNTYTTAEQTRPAVAAAPDGRFVVAWESRGQDGSLFGVFARRYDATGAPLGAEFQVNEFTTSGQLAPDVAVRPDGSFVVVWMSAQDGSGNSVHGRVFGPDGIPAGPEFQVNTTTALSQTFPRVAGTLGERFVVVWESDAQDGSDDGIYAQRFDADGVRLGSEFRVNTYTTGRQAFPMVAASGDARFTVTWESLGQDGSLFGIFGRQYQHSGFPHTAEFRVNSTTTGSQLSPRVAADEVGNVVVVWDGPDGSGTGAFGQRFGGLRPHALSILDGNNGVLELDDDFATQISWRNVSGAALAVEGDRWGSVTPMGIVLTLSNSADYGTVPDGGVGTCQFVCYAGSLSGVRPAGHVDISVAETVLDLSKWWTIHVGESFSDVPRTSPFYRFVETLFHHGITGGCSATQYCPAAPTTREQMAVFVLVAKEGSGYAPPACVPPNVFGDVPETSPFCRWIEELAGRGVVGGCGGGNYCPAVAVTREQMAVFVLRTLDPALDPPACTTPMFADVPASSGFCRWIEELARRGVVSGCGGGNYCPGDPVTREQMGVFISVTFGLSLYGP